MVYVLSKDFSVKKSLLPKKENKKKRHKAGFKVCGNVEFLKFLVQNFSYTKNILDFLQKEVHPATYTYA